MHVKIKALESTNALIGTLIYSFTFTNHKGELNLCIFHNNFSSSDFFSLNETLNVVT